MPDKGKFNSYGELKFGYFFSKFINRFILDDLYLNENFFKIRVDKGIILIFNRFISEFENFDLIYKTYFMQY